MKKRYDKYWQMKCVHQLNVAAGVIVPNNSFRIGDLNLQSTYSYQINVVE